MRVRSAGFPYALLEPLRLEEVGRALASVDEIESEMSRLAPPLEELARAHPEHWKTWVASLKKRVRRALEGCEPLEEPGEQAAPGAVERWNELAARWNELAGERRARLAALEPIFAQDLERARRHLWFLTTEHQIRDALFFSSPRAALTLEGAATSGELPARNSKVRERELTAMMFLQRFCAKNDSISYYGPIYWGDFAADAPRSIDMAHRSDALVSRRVVSFEYWAIAALARTISADPEVMPHLVPQIAPAYRLDASGRAFRADGEPVELTPAELEVLSQVAEGRRVGELGEPLRRLLARGIAEATLFVPAERGCEQVLIDQLQALPESCRARAVWLEKIEALKRHVEGFAEIPLDRHAERRRAFQAVEQAYAATAGEPPRRGAGEMYVGRAVLYEDCERGFERFQLGGTLARDLEGLAPLLEIASWSMNAFGQREHARHLAAHRALRSAPDGAVPLYRLYRATAQSGDTLAGLAARKVQEIIENTWAAYLDGHDREWRDREEVVLPERALDDVRAALPEVAELPERSVALQAPDVMIAAESLEQIERGDYRLVMGELHKGVFVAVIPWACTFQPDPRAVEAEFLAWCGRRPIMDLGPPDGNRAAANWPNIDEHLQVDHDSGCPTVSRERLVPISELEVVEGSDGWLWIRRRGTDERFFLLEVVRREFIRHLLSVDPVSLPGDVTPRVRWGRVVLSRRRWRLRPEQFPPAADPGLPLFLAVRRWAKRLGLPERTFLRVPQEPKPLLIDLGNPFCAEILAKQLRRADRASLSEMLPGPSDLWLPGPSGGDRYTVELRLTMYRGE